MLYRDYNKPIQGSLKTQSVQWNVITLEVQPSRFLFRLGNPSFTTILVGVLSSSKRNHHFWKWWLTSRDKAFDHRSTVQQPFWSNQNCAIARHTASLVTGKRRFCPDFSGKNPCQTPRFPWDNSGAFSPDFFHRKKRFEAGHIYHALCFCSKDMERNPHRKKTVNISTKHILDSCVCSWLGRLKQKVFPLPTPDARFNAHQNARTNEGSSRFGWESEAGFWWRHSRGGFHHFSDRTYPWAVDIRRFVSCNLCRCLGHFIFQGVKLTMSGFFGSFSWKASIWFGRGGSSDARNSGSCRSLLMPSTRRLQSARTETGRYWFVFLKSLVCLFIRLVGSKGSDFPHDISVTLWYRNQTLEIYSRWWFQTLFIFNPKIGKDEPILTSIFFRWVESWNHQPVLNKSMYVYIVGCWRLLLSPVFEEGFPLLNILSWV